MSEQELAWWVIVGAALGGAATLYYLLRKLSNSLIRNVFIGLVLTFFVVPAPLPDYPDEWAPAFVVCMFEAFFQIDGQPATSLRILLIAMALVAALIGLAHVLIARVRRPAPEA